MAGKMRPPSFLDNQENFGDIIRHGRIM